jgi:hypothetical protein
MSTRTMLLGILLLLPFLIWAGGSLLTGDRETPIPSPSTISKPESRSEPGPQPVTRAPDSARLPAREAKKTSPEQHRDDPSSGPSTARASRPTRSIDSALGRTSHDPDERAQAYEEALGRADVPSPALALEGLRDTEAQVRLRVLAGALLADVSIPLDTVQSLALTDMDPLVRGAALAAIAAHPEVDLRTAEHIARRASADPDPAVHSAALELLDHLSVSQAIEARQMPDPAGTTGEFVDSAESAVPLDPQ